MEEMVKRGFKVSQEWMDKNYRGKTCPLYEDLAEEKLTSPIYSEHDATYYEECLANLREKGIELACLQFITLLVIFSNNKDETFRVFLRSSFYECSYLLLITFEL